MNQEDQVKQVLPPPFVIITEEGKVLVDEEGTFILAPPTNAVFN